MTAISYPAWLERWWLDYARATLERADDRSCLQTLEETASKLSDLFTTHRSADFGRYASSPKFLLAYGIMFFPQTYVRAAFPLAEAISRHGWRPPTGRATQLLDLGAGTGAATLSLAQALLSAGAPRVEATALEASQTSGDLFRRIVTDGAAHVGEARFSVSLGDIRTPRTWPESSGTWDVIVASFSLNEAFFGSPIADYADWLRMAADKLSPDGLFILLEPAQRESSETIERLRDAVAREGNLQILGPCLHANPCPLLLGREHWCHEVRTWRPPDSLVYLNRNLKRPIENLKFSFLTVGREKRPMPVAPAEEHRFRMVAPMAGLKGRLVTAGCTTAGKRNTYEIQTRGLSKQQVRELEAIERGEVLSCSAVTALGDGTQYRVAADQVLKLG